jgi:hypothetical protein
LGFDQAYVNPLSGVLADYVYNSILTGRPYLLQMMEDLEIATRFFKAHVNPGANFAITGTGSAYTLASATAETFPGIKLLSQPTEKSLKWSDLVKDKIEVWPIEYLLPGGAYIH